MSALVPWDDEDDEDYFDEGGDDDCYEPLDDEDEHYPPPTICDQCSEYFREINEDPPCAECGEEQGRMRNLPPADGQGIEIHDDGIPF